MHSIIDVSQTLSNLSIEERERFFQIITENSDLFRKIIPDMLDRGLLDDSSRELNHPVAKHFNEWRDR